MLVAICPNNKKHGTFITSAHVSQDWFVDRFGNFLDVSNGANETVADPDKGNIWNCKTCGAEAHVHEVDESNLQVFLAEAGIVNDSDTEDEAPVEEAEELPEAPDGGLVMYFDVDDKAIQAWALPPTPDVEELRAKIHEYAARGKFPGLTLEQSARVASVVSFQGGASVLVSFKHEQLRNEVGRIWALLHADRADDAMWAAHAVTSPEERDAAQTAVEHEDEEPGD